MTGNEKLTERLTIARGTETDEEKMIEMMGDGDARTENLNLGEKMKHGMNQLTKSRKNGRRKETRDRMKEANDRMKEGM